MWPLIENPLYDNWLTEPCFQIGEIWVETGRQENGVESTIISMKNGIDEASLFFKRR